MAAASGVELRKIVGKLSTYTYLFASNFAAPSAAVRPSSLWWPSWPSLASSPARFICRLRSTWGASNPASPVHVNSSAKCRANLQLWLGSNRMLLKHAGNPSRVFKLNPTQIPRRRHKRMPEEKPLWLHIHHAFICFPPSCNSLGILVYFRLVSVAVVLHCEMQKIYLVQQCAFIT